MKPCDHAFFNILNGWGGGGVGVRDRKDLRHDHGVSKDLKSNYTDGGIRDQSPIDLPVGTHRILGKKDVNCHRFGRNFMMKYFQNQSHTCYTDAKYPSESIARV